MARHISGTASQVSGPQVSGATAEGMVSAPSVNGGAADAAATAAAASNGPSSGPSGTLSPENLPSIRFSAYYDPRSSRPSLIFPPMTRTLPTGTEVIRVGRYSDRELRPAPSAPGRPSAAPVGFKSKVVSRRHCEFWYDRGQWWIKDVKSSSGTFLNHIRLSSPGVESKPFPVNDGDIVQLGIDFKGGEEMIFRCVKMRLELNRNWQRNLNTFKYDLPGHSLSYPIYIYLYLYIQHLTINSCSMAIHKKLRNMTTSGSSSYSQDCSICLNSIAVRLIPDLS